ncbi:rod shape-determining protein MreC [Pararobbsia silviterrae]|uniref:Cell shape-determining protein MreC n=1 Tax=Pararobbsia silviterrae TaxID=1792498 RepID=A0A494Y8V6_9BURK|nr:rod shape-determining protein MreC [Pararobbsia silviterrae]RKP58585.1 rod shape-determining protein MreC [Pararobbsia silviterrae]
MEYSPPPLFKQGPSALARLIFFVALALGLLISDARFRTLEAIREVIGTGLYPLQRAALVPRDIGLAVADFFVTGTALHRENTELKSRNLQLALHAGQAQQLEAENAHLRALLELTRRSAIQSVPAEIAYDTRDPFTQKVIIDHGSTAGIQPGAPVVNENGVIGQVTRVYPLQAEVTLLTDKDQALPVQLVRTGLRSVIYGTPAGDGLDLRFVPISADVKVGDQLVTSGLDGVYPAGLPVARVVRVDRKTDTAFTRVLCEPVSPIHGERQVLVLHYDNVLLPPPPDSAVGEQINGPQTKATSKDAKSKNKAASASSEASGAAVGVAASDASLAQTVAGSVSFDGDTHGHLRGHASGQAEVAAEASAASAASSAKAAQVAKPAPAAPAASDAAAASAAASSAPAAKAAPRAPAPAKPADDGPHVPARGGIDE